jgi:hypothetical protein
MAECDSEVLPPERWHRLTAANDGGELDLDKIDRNCEDAGLYKVRFGNKRR